MGASTALDRGRAAYADRRWRAAVEELGEANRERPIPATDAERLATAAILTGRVTDGLDLLATAHTAYRSAGDICAAARCAVWLGIQLMNQGARAQSSGWFGRAQRLLEQHDLRCPAEGFLLLPQALGALYGGDAATAEQTFAEMARVAEFFADPDLIALSQLGQGQAQIMLGRTEGGLGLLDEAMVAVTAGEVSPIPSGIIYCAVIAGCHLAFDLHRAQEWTAALDRWCESQPDLVPFTGQCQMHRAELYCMHGAWSEALAVARRAEERFQAGDRQAVYGAYYQQGEVQRLRGDYPAAAESYRQANQSGFEPQPGLALLLLAQGKTAAAQTMLRRTVEGADPAARRRLLPALVHIELAAGDLAAARTVAEELRGLAASHPMPLIQAWAASADGAVLLAEGAADQALGRLREAWRRWLELDVPYEAAHCRVLAGRACRALGDEDSAQMEFEAARAVFADLGAGPELDAVAQLSRQGPASPTGPLTPRECEVLRLVAAGKTNRAIGTELFLSEKTVARHVSNIFAKLDLSSRAAATAYAYQHGLP